MKQPDALTPDAPQQPPLKRGRPKKENALTGAERAKRYRDARRGEPKSVTVTKNECGECAKLRDEVQRLKHRVVVGEVQALADGITLKKKNSTIAELRRELKLAKQPANKRNVTDVAFVEVATDVDDGQ